MISPEIANSDVFKKISRKVKSQVGFQETHREKLAKNKLPQMLNHLFHALGQDHVIHLIKLRKMWFHSVDEFLAQNAYPRNIKTSWQWKIDYQAVEILKNYLRPVFHESLTLLTNKTFSSAPALREALEKDAGTCLDETENHWFLRLQKKQDNEILHLVVYDGGFAQIIYLEMERYLKLLNQSVPGLHIKRIECHVGDLGQARQDQIWVGKLATHWNEIIPEPVASVCMPAFIHRISSQKAILVLYVMDGENAQTLPGSDWFLGYCQEAFPELHDVLASVSLFAQKKVTLNAVRANSMWLGATQTDAASNQKNEETLNDVEEVAEDNSEYISRIQALKQMVQEKTISVRSPSVVESTDASVEWADWSGKLSDVLSRWRVQLESSRKSSDSK
ncbi:MAG: hypothetical protein HQM11_06470 [SAR324 cluster bacterium]|nr:hypothetical protein [SAR324 cluster bacterium]